MNTPLVNEDFKARLDKIKREFYETKEAGKARKSNGTTSILKGGATYKTSHQKRDSPKRVKLVTTVREQQTASAQLLKAPGTLLKESWPELAEATA